MGKKTQNKLYCKIKLHIVGDVGGFVRSKSMDCGIESEEDQSYVE